MKNSLLLLRFEPEEKRILEELAWLKKMSMAEFIRWLITREYKKKSKK